MLKLDDLHDAILETINIDVSAARLVLTFTPVAFDGAPDTISLVAHNWKVFSCPKQEPWGLSAEWRVNEGRGPFQVGSGLTRIELEMQSGDTIGVHAALIERTDIRRT